MMNVRQCIENNNLPFNKTEKINPTISIMDNDVVVLAGTTRHW